MRSDAASLPEQATSADFRPEPKQGPEIPCTNVETDNRKEAAVAHLPSRKTWLVLPGSPTGMRFPTMVSFYPV